MSRQRTTLVVVGAGPTGLAAAISLAKSGFRDFMIVDEASIKDEASRAIAVHAATLEALDSVGCVEPLVRLGIKGKGVQLSDRTRPIFTADCFCLEPYTRFPYILLLSQIRTEEILEVQLKQLGIQVLRPDKAIGLKSTDSGDLEVTFESGNVINTRYVVGADGSRSVIRQLAGIGFADPDGTPPDERLAQMMLADVMFSSDNPHLPRNQAFVAISGNRFFLTIPLPNNPDFSEAVYRIGFNVLLSEGEPPWNPTMDYLQRRLDEHGPIQLSSDPSANPHPLNISKVVWATRFRTHAAIADQFMTRMPKNSDTRQNQGIVLLIGDAAHIHSPAGGQGMNLGIRDAISLGPVLAAHIASGPETFAENDQLLENFMAMRRERALNTILLTKRIMAIVGMLGSIRFFYLSYWLIRLMGMIPFVQRRVIWNLSGLGNR